LGYTHLDKPRRERLVASFQVQRAAWPSLEWAAVEGATIVFAIAAAVAQAIQ
jgi:hypothetical protein